MEAASALALLLGMIFSAVAAWFVSRALCGFCREYLAVATAANGGNPVTGSLLLQQAEHAVENLFIRIPGLRQARKRARSAMRRQQLRKGMPQAIRLICISLDSGGSLNQALAYAAENSSGPISKELKHAVWDVKAGKSFQEAMESLRSRTGEGEFACLSVAMEIQHSCGGTLSAVLGSVSQMLEQSAELEEDLITKTTQAQLSARVIAAMPAVVLVLLSLVSPGFIMQFFESPMGVAILILAVLLEAIGAVLVRRSLAVDTGVGSMGS